MRCAVKIEEKCVTTVTTICTATMCLPFTSSRSAAYGWRCSSRTRGRPPSARCSPCRGRARAAWCCPMLARTLFVTLTNSTRQNSSPGPPFSLPNFKWSVLRCIEADFCDQIRVGKRLTRSTNSTFFSRPQLSIFCKMFVKFVKMLAKLLSNCCHF